MKKIAIILFLFLCSRIITAQINPSFHHLNTSNGLSYGGVNDMCFDKKGNLWIATGNGLNMFNGKTTEKFFEPEYKQFISSNIIHVTCDSNNRIWILAYGGNVTMLDEKRQAHRVGLYKGNTFIKTAWILNSPEGNITLWTKEGHYIFNAKSSWTDKDSLTEKHFSPVTINGFETLVGQRYRQVFYYDPNNYLFVNDSAFYKVNYRSRKVEKKYAIPNCRALIKWKENELLACDQISNEIEAIDLTTEKITFPFKNLRDQYGKTITATILFAEKIDANRFILTSVNEGIFIYNQLTKTIYNYRHQVADPTSLGCNTQSTLVVNKEGWIFINCNPQGISYFNINDFIGKQYVFTDNKGNGYDSYTAGIVSSDNNTYYIGTTDGLLEWKRNTNTTNFIDFTGKNGRSVFGGRDITSIVMDKFNNVWVAINDYGIIVMNKERKFIKEITDSKPDKINLKFKNVNRLFVGADGYVWTCGTHGISRINPSDFEIDYLNNTPLQQFDTTNVLLLHFADKENLWIATSAVSLYHYNISANSLAEAEEYKKYKANGIFDMKSDSAGNIYTGTKKGMVILFKSGRTKAIAQQEGLIANWAEGLLLDKHNRMWIGNDFGVVCYNPADSGIRTFDERFGLSIYGITIGAYYQMPNGEFVFGTPKGIEYFQPDSLYNKKINLSVSVNKIETRQILSNITSSTTFNLSPSDNLVTFYFGTVDFNKYIRIYYQYKLEGVDKDWINIADQNSVRYNSIPPGKYVFKVRVSNDGKNWQGAENEVTIIIAKAIYQQVWFKIIGVLFGLFLIGYVIRFYRKKQELQKKELINKQKLTESRLQSLRLQMNPHFLFNALNSIQQMILANEEMVATKYLSRFSKLLRTVLVHSDKENVSLKEEIDILKMYVELESVRFKESFTYTITCDEEIETEEIKIPTLLIQPFVENAIWHGLMHKEGNRHLNISFTEKQDFLQCIIEDNGVGRKKATEIKTSTGQDKKHTSKGIAVSEERLKTMKNSSGRPGSIQINDLTNAGGEGTGTQVIINFPIQN